MERISKLVRDVGNYFATKKAAQREVRRQYEALFLRCHDGTPEEVKRKVANLDWVLRTTRAPAIQYRY